MVRLAGWSLEQIRDTSAVDLDWLVHIDRLHRQVENAKADEKS